MKVDRSEAFKKDFQKLDKDVRRAAEKQIVQLLMDHAHPSLRLEGIRGRKGVFSVRVNDRYRMSLSFEEDGAILLRRILDHDDLYEAP
jgi:mRNA-degrading endonuclease RelE of RelBE toxin-antitoxin system